MGKIFSSYKVDNSRSPGQFGCLPGPGSHLSRHQLEILNYSKINQINQPTPEDRITLNLDALSVLAPFGKLLGFAIPTGFVVRQLLQEGLNTNQLRH